MKNQSVLGLKNISNRELLILAPTLKKLEPDNEKIFAKIHLIDDLLSIQKLGDSLDIGTRTRAGYLKKDAKLGTIAIKKALADRLEAFIEESNF